MVTRTYLIRGDKANNGAIISGGSDSYFWHNVSVARGRRCRVLPRMQARGQNCVRRAARAMFGHGQGSRTQRRYLCLRLPPGTGLLCLATVHDDHRRNGRERA